MLNLNQSLCIGCLLLWNKWNDLKHSVSWRLVVVESAAARKDELQWESACQICTYVIFVITPFSYWVSWFSVVKPQVYNGRDCKSHGCKEIHFLRTIIFTSYHGFSHILSSDSEGLWPRSRWQLPTTKKVDKIFPTHDDNICYYKVTELMSFGIEKTILSSTVCQPLH